MKESWGLVNSGTTPELTRSVYELQHEGLLHAAPVTRMRHLDGVQPGINPVPIHHIENTTSSPEEAAVVVELVQRLGGFIQLIDSGGLK